MTISFRSHLIGGIAVVAVSSMVAAPSLVPRPLSPPVTAHTVELTAAVAPSWSPPKSADISTLADEVQRGIVPSAGAVFPAPPVPAPSTPATDFADAIKNTYVAIEPWVRYGFELATYAAGWVPYVGWFSGQIMIFYNFGERIVRSLVFNSADWLWGPLPFGQGVRNIAQDSWDALVQLGIDEWNYFLPPLPPLPLAAEQNATPAAPAPVLTTTQQDLEPAHAHAVRPLRERLELPDGGDVDTTEHAVDTEAASAASEVTPATTVATRTRPVAVQVEATTDPDEDGVKPRRQSLPRNSSAERSTAHAQPSGEAPKAPKAANTAKARDAAPDPAQGKSAGG